MDSILPLPLTVSPIRDLSLRRRVSQYSPYVHRAPRATSVARRSCSPYPSESLDSSLSGGPTGVAEYPESQELVIWKLRLRYQYTRTTSDSMLTSPGLPLPLEVGDIKLHSHASGVQIWVGKHAEPNAETSTLIWEAARNGSPHPALAKYVLRVKPGDFPKWVTVGTFRNRK